MNQVILTLVFLAGTVAQAAPRQTTIYLFEPNSPAANGPEFADATDAGAFVETQLGNADYAGRRAPDDAVNASAAQYSCGMDLSGSDDRDDDNLGAFFE